MKPEIKFRGLDTRTGNWVYGSYHNIKGNGQMRIRTATDKGYEDRPALFDNHMIFTPQLPDTSGWSYRDTYYPYDVHKESVGQYTGLKDKNGVEIYEGDVLREGNAKSSTYEVIWDAKYAKFKLDHTRVSTAIQYPEWNRGINMEIIGNIHEHPHLLTNPQN